MVSSLLTALVTHLLKKDERLETSRLAFEEKKMASWAQLHGCMFLDWDPGDKMRYDDLAPVSVKVISTFLTVGHHFDDNARDDLWRELGLFQRAALLVRRSREGVNLPRSEAEYEDDACRSFRRIYTMIEERHLQASANFFSTHGR